jgi:hypothetical protein
VKRIEVTVPMSIRSTERDELITAIQNATGLEEISLTRKSTKGYYVVSDQESYGYVGKTVAAIDQFCAANNLGWKRLKEEPGGWIAPPPLSETGPRYAQAEADRLGVRVEDLPYLDGIGY